MIYVCDFFRRESKKVNKTRYRFAKVFSVARSRFVDHDVADSYVFLNE